MMPMFTQIEYRYFTMGRFYNNIKDKNLLKLKTT